MCVYTVDYCDKSLDTFRYTYTQKRCRDQVVQHGSCLSLFSEVKLETYFVFSKNLLIQCEFQNQDLQGRRQALYQVSNQGHISNTFNQQNGKTQKRFFGHADLAYIQLLKFFSSNLAKTNLQYIFLVILRTFTSYNQEYFQVR